MATPHSLCHQPQTSPMRRKWGLRQNVFQLPYAGISPCYKNLRCFVLYCIEFYLSTKQDSCILKELAPYNLGTR